MNDEETLNDEDMESLIDGCMRYIHASKLPTPLPTNPLVYVQWREKALAERTIDEDAEDAWFELDRLVAEKPNLGWRVLTRLALRCGDEDECAQVAAGPLSTFLRAHGEAFASRMDEELMQNEGLRVAYHWLQLEHES